MTETLRDLFGTMEAPKPVAPVFVPEPIEEAPKPSLREQRRAILSNKAMKGRDKIQALRALRCQPIR